MIVTSKVAKKNGKNYLTITIDRPKEMSDEQWVYNIHIANLSLEKIHKIVREFVARIKNDME